MKKFFFCLNLFIIAWTSPLRAEVLEKEHPVVILGSGIAAMTAATYLARGGIAPLVITGPSMGGAIIQSHNVQNWPGEISISGLDLSEKIKSQAEKNGAILVPEVVTAVDFSKHPLTIETRPLFGQQCAKNYKAQAVIIAVGATPRLLNVPGETGENGYWSRGVYNCAVCDGALYKGKVVAVVGGGDSALTETQYLSNIAEKVHVFVRHHEFKTVERERMLEILSRPNVEVHYRTVIREVKGDGQKMTHLCVQDTITLDTWDISADALFLAIGSLPNTEMFQGQLELDPQGYIVLKNHQETSVEGVYAIGDVADPEFKQAISAAGDAAKAALQAEKYLVSYHSLVHRSSQHTQNLQSEEIIEITSKEQFVKELHSSKKVVFVDFYSTHCGPCRIFGPLFDNWAKEFGDRIKFLKVNAEKAIEVFKTYQIHVVPTLLILDEKGHIVRKSSGFKEITTVEKCLEKVKGKSEPISQDFK